MRRSSIVLLTVVSAIILCVFWSAVYFLSQFFPNSKENLTRPTFKTTVTIVKDTQGVSTLESTQRDDLLRAQGLVTARDRFFQMELIRRKMAGELSELFGEAALESDVLHRRMGFKQVADRAWEQMDPKTKTIWQSFSEGVNDYLSFEVLPWEIKLLGYSPKSWRAQDGLLVVLSMFESLNDFDNGEELAYNELNNRFSKKMVEFLTWDFGFLDAPLKVFKRGNLQGRIPSRIDFDLRSTASSVDKIRWKEKEVYGSNAWVVSGANSDTGKPLLAGDPHLNITVPNIWYRVELKDPELSVRGVTVPGIPGVVIGRNNHLAWSFTNSRADVQDFIELGSQFNEEIVPAELQEFLRLVKREEKIQIKGGKEHLIKCWDSAYGPLVEEKLESGLKYKRILQWTALDPNPLSQLNPLALDQSHQLDELWGALSRWGGPVQNILVATQDNHIAWGMVGKIPDQRKDFGRTSSLIKERSVWKQYIPWEEMPRVVDPIEGFVASGNQNMWIESIEKYRWGHDWPSPARGFQIRKLLLESSTISVDRMQAIQNEIYSPVHVWYRDRLVEAIRNIENQNKPLSPWVEEILNLVGVWDGKAGIDSAAYSLLREFRLAVLKNAMSPFVARTAPYRHEEVMALIAKDSVVQMLLLNKPFHLLNPQYNSWDELLIVSATEAAGQLAKSPKELSKVTWGTRNILQARHPFSSRIPSFLARLINLPERSLAGDGLVVHVSKPKNGASMRMVIDVSNTEHSLYSQPGGQSGYFLSPHYQDLFESWYVGKGRSFESSQVESKQVIHP